MRLARNVALAAFIAAGLACAPQVYAQGTLRVALPSNVNTLDPAKTKIGEEYIVNFLVYSGLTEISRSGQIVPDLAESWSGGSEQKT